MALQPMYPAANSGIPPVLTDQLSATDTTIPLDDASGLPPGPNIATVSMEDYAELVFYTGVADDSLTGCIRGYNGTVARIWDAGTAVYRAYTAADHQSFMDNIGDLEARKLDAGGDGSGLTLGAGEDARTLGELGGAAFAELGTGAGDAAPGLHATQHAADGADPLTPEAIGALQAALLAQADGVASLDANGKLAQALPDLASIPMYNATLLNGVTTPTRMQYGRYNGFGFIAGTIDVPTTLASKQFFALPAGFRPNRQIWALAPSGSGDPSLGRFIQINESGVVNFYGSPASATYARFNFSSIYFIGS